MDVEKEVERGEERRSENREEEKESERTGRDVLEEDAGGGGISRPMGIEVASRVIHAPTPHLTSPLMPDAHPSDAAQMVRTRQVY